MNFFSDIHDTQITRRPMRPLSRSSRRRPGEAELRASAIARAAVLEILD